MKKISIKSLLKMAQIPDLIEVTGWVRTFRSNKFIALNDGSTVKNLQLVITENQFSEDLIKQINTGACIKAKGFLKSSEGKGQSIELLLNEIELIGACDASEYPIQPKKHSLEFLRTKGHLRWRTNTFGAIFRIRHALSFAIHEYFHRNEFFNVHSPILTSSDCEGAGEMFQVTTMDLLNVHKNTSGSVDWSKDFFGKATNLTVSGQLQAEIAALALGKVYTFGPTFRSENSNTSRHLAEFWMIEPEVAFNTLEDNKILAEDFLKSMIRFVLEHCNEDLLFLDERLTTEQKEAKVSAPLTGLSLIETLEFVTDNDFAQISYTDAVDILLNSDHYKKGKFNFPVTWGGDLQSEHERYLVELYFKKPVIVTDYPKDLKAFYMKQNTDGKTVAAMDVLFPGIGEIIGGSQREEDETKLRKRMIEMNISTEELSWYLDLRRFGTAPHSGFGLGFERLVQFVTGMSNIRDVIGFPRTPKNIEF